MILNGLRIYQQSWRSMGIRPNASATAMQSDRGGLPLRHPALRAAEPKIPLIFKFYSWALCRKNLRDARPIAAVSASSWLSKLQF